MSSENVRIHVTTLKPTITRLYNYPECISGLIRYLSYVSLLVPQFVKTRIAIRCCFVFKIKK